MSNELTLSIYSVSLFILSPIYPKSIKTLFSFILSSNQASQHLQQRQKQRLLSRFNSSNYIKSIGNTPLERWSSISDAVAIISPSEKPSGGVWLKREDKNPGGTAKDRVAKSVLLGWLTRGLSVSGVVEGSSGSTGIAWASICKEVGLPFRCYVPDDQSESKFRKIRELGGSVVVVKTASISSGEHYVNRARNDAREREGWR